MKRSPAITASSRPPLDGDLGGLDAAAATTRPLAGGEDGGQVRRPEGARLAPAALTGGPPVAREDPGCSFPGRARLPEARRARKRAAATAVDALDGALPCSWSSAR